MISDRQMKRTLMIELFSTTGLFLSAMAQNLQQLAAGMAGAAVYAIYFLWIGRNYDIAQTGKIRKAVYSFRFFLYACFLGSLQKLLVSDMLLYGSSGWYVFLPLFLLALYANRGGREERARLMEALFWFIFLPLFLVLILAVKEIHFPFLMEGEFRPERSIRVFLCFCSLEILLFFQGKRKEKTKALLFVFVLNVLVFAVTAGMYGTKIIQGAELPVITIIRMIRLPGGFVERLDIFILSFWILSLFAIFSAYCFYGTIYWKNEGKKLPVVSLLFYTGVFIVTAWNNMDLQTLINTFQTYVLWVDIPLAVLLPLLGSSRMKRTIAVTMIATLLFIVTGCGPNRIDIEDRAYILALGVEKQDFLWNVSFFLPDDQCIEAKGRDWEEVKESFQRVSGKALEMGHLKALVIADGTDVTELEAEWKEENYPKTVLLFETLDSMEQLQEADKKDKAPLGSELTNLAKRNQRQVTLGDYLSGQKKIPRLRIRTDLLMIE